jgi:hypothetical protein
MATVERRRLGCFERENVVSLELLTGIGNRLSAFILLLSHC